MLPIDYHVQNALYKFNREMKRLTRATVLSLAGQPLGSPNKTLNTNTSN